MESTLKKTDAAFRCVGTVYEKALVREDCKVKTYKDGKPTGDEIPAERIRGNLSIRIPSGIVTFNVYFASLDTKGEKNRAWSMAVAMHDNWKAEINGSKEEPTTVNIRGSLEPNDYLSQLGEAKYSIRYRITQANTKVLPDEAHGMSISVTAFINTIRPEVVNEDETGRLTVELLGATYKGECYPIVCYVDEDSANSFEEVFEAKQTGKFDIDLNIRHIGKAQNNQKKAFGKSSSLEVNDGFEITELMIVGADPVEEPDELTTTNENGEEVEIPTDWINPNTIQKALKIRKQKLDEMVKSGVTSSKGSGGSYADKKAALKNRLASKKTEAPSHHANDEDDIPFDVDEEF